MRLRPGAEHARDRSRRTALELHPRARSSRSASATAGRSSTTTAATTARARDARPAVLRRRRPLHQPLGRHRGSGATSTRASRARCSSIPTRRSRSSPSPRAKPWYVEFFQRLRSPVHVRRRTSARRPRRCRPASSPGTRPGSRSRWTTGRTDRAPPRDRFTTVMTWQIESFTDVGGNKDSGVREVHRPAVADRRSPSSWRSTARSSCCATHGWSTRRRDGASRARLCGLSRLHPVVEGRVRRRQAHLRRRRDPAGSAIAPSAISRPGRPALVQDTGWTRAPAGRRGPAGVLDAGRSARRHRRASTPTTPATRRRAREIAREHFDGAACCRRSIETRA